MSFGDQHKVYTRLEAMKVAKEQALVRETHADFLKEGKNAPNDLMDKYKKTLSQKLGPYRRSAPTPESPPRAPEQGARAAAPSPQPVTNGAPKPGQPTSAMPNPTSTSTAATTATHSSTGARPPATSAQPTYGVHQQQAHSWAPPYQSAGTTTAMPQYGGLPSALAPPQGLFQQNAMGGTGGYSSYRPPGAQHQAYPMRWG